MDKKIEIANGDSAVDVMKILEKATKSLIGIIKMAKMQIKIIIFIHESSYVDENVKIGRRYKNMAFFSCSIWFYPLEKIVLSGKM